MAESAKDSVVSGNSGASANPVIPQNVARAVRQHLLSLKTAGVAQLARSTEAIQFPGLVPAEASPPQPTQAASPTVPSRPNTKSGSPSKTSLSADAVRESASTSKPSLAQPEAQKTIVGTGGFFPAADSYGPTVAAEERAAQLQVIQTEVEACTLCDKLASTRTQTVFGVGNFQPKLVFLGEAPGADEDRQGEPFVGAAGQLLDKIIQAMKLSRQEVYILNTLKCRPPGNRNPSEGELANCCNFGVRQLEILQPEIICCLGSIAAKTLLNTKQSIGKMRGQFFQWRGSRVVVTYHPAYLLRTPSAKKHVWNDMKLIMAELGLTP